MYWHYIYVKKSLSITITLLASLTLVSCKVGPDFHSPDAPNVSQYIEGSVPETTASVQMAGSSGRAQHFLQSKNIPDQWWYIFHSRALNSLIDAGLANSPNLVAAKAALKQAQANYVAQFGTLLPTITGNFSAERQRFSFSEFGGTNSTAIGSSVFNLFNANVSMAYTLDVFGGLRRQLEAAGAQVDYQWFELEAAFLTLSSNIVTTGITIASIRAQITATHQLIRAQEKTLVIMKKQRTLGGESLADILLQENQLEQTRATLSPFEQSLAVNLHTLSTLVGQFPSEKLVPDLSLASLNLPMDLPLTCPSSLVRQRPDIQAAEALVHAASAQIGVTIANMLPQVNITGNYGWQSTMLSNLFEGKNNVWSIAAAAAQPIFNGGSLIARNKAAIAAYEQAAAQYQQTVLLAFQNVADTLRALEHDAEFLKAQRKAEAAAYSSFNLAQKQFQLGSVSYLNLLITERAYQQALINRIKAQTARYIDTATLFQALGGGWWNRPPLDCNLALIQNMNQYKPGCFGKNVAALKSVH